MDLGKLMGQLLRTAGPTLPRGISLVQRLQRLIFQQTVE